MFCPEATHMQYLNHFLFILLTPCFFNLAISRDILPHESRFSPRGVSQNGTNSSQLGKERYGGIIADLYTTAIQIDPTTGDGLLQGMSSLHLVNTSTDNDIRVRVGYDPDAFGGNGTLVAEVLDFGPGVSDVVAPPPGNESLRGIYNFLNTTTVTNKDVLNIATGEGALLDVIRQRSIWTSGPGNDVYDDSLLLRALCARLNITLSSEADGALSRNTAFSQHYGPSVKMTITNITYSDVDGFSKVWLVTPPPGPPFLSYTRNHTNSTSSRASGTMRKRARPFISTLRQNKGSERINKKRTGGPPSGGGANDPPNFLDPSMHRIEGPPQEITPAMLGAALEAVNMGQPEVALGPAAQRWLDAVDAREQGERSPSDRIIVRADDLQSIEEEIGEQRTAPESGPFNMWSNTRHFDFDAIRGEAGIPEMGNSPFSGFDPAAASRSGIGNANVEGGNNQESGTSEDPNQAEANGNGSGESETEGEGEGSSEGSEGGGSTSSGSGSSGAEGANGCLKMKRSDLYLRGLCGSPTSQPWEVALAKAPEDAVAETITTVTADIAETVLRSAGALGLLAAPVIILVDLFGDSQHPDVRGAVLGAVGIAAGVAATRSVSAAEGASNGAALAGGIAAGDAAAVDAGLAEAVAASGPIGWVIGGLVELFVSVFAEIGVDNDLPSSTNATEILRFRWFGNKETTGNEKCRAAADGNRSLSTTCGGNTQTCQTPSACAPRYGPGYIAAKLAWNIFDAIVFLIQYNAGHSMTLVEIAGVFQPSIYNTSKEAAQSGSSQAVYINCQNSPLESKPSGTFSGDDPGHCYQAKFVLNRSNFTVPVIDQRADRLFARMNVSNGGDCVPYVDGYGSNGQGVDLPNYGLSVKGRPCGFACGVSAGFNVSGTVVPLGVPAFSAAVLSPGNQSTTQETGRGHIDPPLNHNGSAPGFTSLDKTTAVCLRANKYQCMPSGNFSLHNPINDFNFSKLEAIDIPPQGGSLSYELEWLGVGGSGGIHASTSNTYRTYTFNETTNTTSSSLLSGTIGDLSSPKQGIKPSFTTTTTKDPPSVCLFEDAHMGAGYMCLGAGGGNLTQFGVQNWAQSLIVRGDATVHVYQQYYGSLLEQVVQDDYADLTQLVSTGDPTKNFNKNIFAVWVSTGQ